MKAEVEKKSPTKKSVKVTVTFPISPAGPYKEDAPPLTTVGSVREAAMAHFGVAADDQHAYFLTHAGVRVPDEETIGHAAGHADAVKFTLVKELIQG